MYSEDLAFYYRAQEFAMAFHRSFAALAAATLAVWPASPVSAGIGDGIVGGLVGGVVSGIIVNEGAKARAHQQQPQTVTRRVYVQPQVDSYSRAENREIQTSLNYFGFPAGAPDGILGGRSRSAISDYQAYMGYPITGHLTTFEKDFLLQSHGRALAGGPNTSHLIATLPDGTRGLLLHYRDEMAGGAAPTGARGNAYGLPPEVAAAVDEIAQSSDPSADQLLQRSGFLQLADLNGDGRTDYLLDTSVTGSNFWCGARDCAVSVFASTPGGYERNDFLAHNATPAMFTCQRGNCRIADGAASGGQGGQGDGTTMVALQNERAQGDSGSALPNFAVSNAAPSLAAYCNKLLVIRTSSGGLSTVGAISDTDLALGEQFCLARSYAISQSDDLIARIPSVDPAQVESQCLGLVDPMQSHVAALSLKPREAVLDEMAGFIRDSGMASAQLTATGQICLGVGYGLDNMELAIASALLLTGQGAAPYDELLGHHLSQGFGAAKRPELAIDWYDSAITALEGGTTPVFAPTQTDRPAVLRGAVFGNSDSASPDGAAGSVPVFSISE